MHAVSRACIPPALGHLELSRLIPVLKDTPANVAIAGMLQYYALPEYVFQLHLERGIVRLHQALQVW
jgi:hypothetical protein